MNIRKIFILVLTIVMLCHSGAYAKTLEFTIGKNSLYVNDGAIEAKELDAPAYIEDSRTMVPLRAVSENFDADVSWDGDARKATIKTEDITIELTIDNKEAIVNGETKLLDVAPVIVSERTMIPLRFVSEALKKNVEYVSASSQILISDEKPVMTIDGYPITLDDYRFMFLYYNLVQGTYTPEQLVPLLTQNFVENVSMANEAKKSGFALHSTQGKELSDSIMVDKDVFYSLALIAPGIKTLSDMLCAIDYISQGFSYNVTAEQVLEEYAKNYVCAKHILISTIDPDTGEEYNTQKMRKAKSVADKVYKEAKGGADFYKLIEEYNEDPGMAYNPDGYIFTKGEMVKEFEAAAYALDENEISKPVKSAYGYHIICRYPLPELSSDMASQIGQQLMQLKLTEYVNSVKESADIVYNMTDEEIIENLNLTNEDISLLIEQMMSSAQ